MHSNIKPILITIFSLFFAIFLLISLDEGTLFLATILLAIVSIKTINSKIEKEISYDVSQISINITIGLWFALSIAPAIGVDMKELSILSNGFLVQTLLSFVLFIAYFKSDISIIGTIKTRIKGGVGVVISALIAGAAAGISSSALWQIYLNIAKTF